MTWVIPKAQWRAFLARFSRAHRGWLLTVHGTAGPESVAATRGPLQEVHLHGDALQLDLLDGGTVIVARPRELRVQQRMDGAESALEIENHEGALMRAAFRATALREALAGVAVSEAAAPRR